MTPLGSILVEEKGTLVKTSKPIRKETPDDVVGLTLTPLEPQVGVSVRLPSLGRTEGRRLDK